MRRIPTLGTAEPALGELDPDLQSWADAIRGTIDVAHLRSAVERFPAPRNRMHSPEAMAQADTLIERGLWEAGYEVDGQTFIFGDIPGNLDYGAYDHVVYERVEGRNIIGVKRGQDEREAVVVDAHHDTVRDSPGADDNTASVVALLELARLLAPYRFRRTIVLTATDMEELSFFGAQAVLPRLTQQWRIVGSIVLETMAYSSSRPESQIVPPGVGQLYPGQVKRLASRRNRGDFTAIIYNNPGTALAVSFAEGLKHLAGPNAPLLLRDPNDLPMIGEMLRRTMPVVRNFSRSNHVVFRQAGMPVLQITDTANFRNPNYHRPSDTPDTLDYDRLAAIVGATAVAVARRAELMA